jgi:hypothetical protein
MTPSLHAVALPGDQILQALPLVQVTWPSTNARAWQSYVDFINSRTGGAASGVIALGDDGNYLSGLMVYEVEHDLEQGAILTVHLFTAVDLANSDTPVRALIETAQAKAAALGCGSLQIRLYEEQTTLGTQLRSLGLSDRAGYLWLRTARVTH